MADQIISVFISSTIEDFVEERKAVKDAVHELNSIVNLCSIAMIAIDLKSGARPNPSTDECLDTVSRSNVLIGLLGLRYGQIDADTGKSITELEYDKAKELNLPILMYIREAEKIYPDWMDTDPQRIAKLKAFREKVEANHKRDTFDTSTELRGHILRDLSRIVLENFAPQIQGQKIGPIEKTRDVQPPDATTEPVAQSGTTEMTSEIQQLLQSISNNIEDEEKIDSHQRRRLYLFAASVFYQTEASGALGTHEIQLIYSDRNSFTPIAGEVSYLARTIFSDRFDVKAGWFWLKRFPSKVLIEHLRWRALNERDADTRIGYLFLLKEFWSSKTEETMCKNAAHETKSIALGALKILHDYGTVNSIETLREVEKIEDNDIKKASRKTQFAILARDDAPRAIEMFKEFEFSEASGIEYELPEVVKKLNEATIAKLRLDENKYLRKVATIELVRREKLSNKELRELTNDGDPYTAYLAYTSLINRKCTLDPDEIMKNWDQHSSRTLFGILSNTQGRDEIILRVLASYSLDDLEKRINWLSSIGHLAYQAWGLKGTKEVPSQVRKDLQNSFERIRKPTIEKLDKTLAYVKDKSVPVELQETLSTMNEMRATAAAGKGYTIDQFNKSALKILLDRPKLDDIPIVKEFMRSEQADIARFATEIFLKLATENELIELIDVTFKESGNLQEEAAAKALAFDKKRLAFDKFLGSENDVLVRICLKNSLLDGVPLENERILKLLHNKKAQIREMAVAYIMKAFNRNNKLERFLNDYLQSETYYYNVVCWLDRIIYAPRNFKIIFRKQLAEKLQ